MRKCEKKCELNKKRPKPRWPSAVEPQNNTHALFQVRLSNRTPNRQAFLNCLANRVAHRNVARWAVAAESQKRVCSVSRAPWVSEFPGVIGFGHFPEVLGNFLAFLAALAVAKLGMLERLSGRVGISRKGIPAHQPTCSTLGTTCTH